MWIVDHAQCRTFIEAGNPQLFCADFDFQNIEAVIPRIGASVTLTGAAVIRQLETMGVYTLTRSDALLRARDKLRCLQLLAQAGVEVPRSFVAMPGTDISKGVEWLGGFPVVMKLVEGTHGAGVMLIDQLQTAVTVRETLGRLREKVIFQEYIKEAEGSDIRAFVVGNKVVATMKRQAQEGEFRSNLHLGASASLVSLNQEETKLVLKATRVLGLEVAGVDLLRSKRGPLILEVNASPGLEGIEDITGIDIAGKIIELLELKTLRFQAQPRKP